MGDAAEWVAKPHTVSREEQDRFSAGNHTRAEDQRVLCERGRPDAARAVQLERSAPSGVLPIKSATFRQTSRHRAGSW